MPYESRIFVDDHHLFADGPTKARTSADLVVTLVELGYTETDATTKVLELAVHERVSA